MSNKNKLLLWEIICILWIAIAGSFLHFLFELTNYLKSIAVFAAVNESIWEHSKMYFWPGLLFALAQYSYTKNYHKNYWFGKAVALFTTPITIVLFYQSYMLYAKYSETNPSLSIMLAIMFLGISSGQLASYKILTSAVYPKNLSLLALPGIATLVIIFSVFTYYPPKIFLFENFACYKYTGEYGILEDYSPYQVFRKVDSSGDLKEGGGVNYCMEMNQN